MRSQYSSILGSVVLLTCLLFGSQTSAQVSKPAGPHPQSEAVITLKQHSQSPDGKDAFALLFITTKDSTSYFSMYYERGELPAQPPKAYAIFQARDGGSSFLFFRTRRFFSTTDSGKQIDLTSLPAGDNVQGVVLMNESKVYAAFVVSKSISDIFTFADAVASQIEQRGYVGVLPGYSAPEQLRLLTKQDYEFAWALNHAFKRPAS